MESSAPKAKLGTVIPERCYNTPASPAGKARRPVSLVRQVDEEVRRLATGETSRGGTGGMATKLEAAAIACRAGALAAVADGREPRILERLLDGEETGTLFLPAGRRLSSRKRWAGFGARPRGRLTVDAGAREALERRGRSLLPAGVTRVEGVFAAGDLVSVVDQYGREFARGLVNFARDIRKYPREIAEAADGLVDGYIRLAKNLKVLFGIRRIVLAMHRSSNDFISPDTFRELSFPSMKKIIEGCVAAGMDVILHCDGNWDLNLETLRELPAGNCIIQFDGPTDIFLAKEVLGNRVCIMGDVPSNMLALGSPSEVDEYCHRLIEEVGKGGGFILGSGCELAPNAKPENVKVMFESIVKYGYY